MKSCALLSNFSTRIDSFIVLNFWKSILLTQPSLIKICWDLNIISLFTTNKNVANRFADGLKTTTLVDDNGELAPVNKLLIDPIQYYKQQSRLNKWKKRKKLTILFT